MPRNLIYTQLVWKPRKYEPLLRLFLKSLLAYSKNTFDVLVICEEGLAWQILEEMPEAQQFKEQGRLHVHRVPRGASLAHALMNKLAIVDVDRKFLAGYERIMFSDCDIVFQKDVQRIWDALPSKMARDHLYAPAEGSLEGAYWGRGRFSSDEIRELKGKVQTFNSGTMVFRPTSDMMRHLSAVREQGLAAIDNNEEHFYDQSFFNHYFLTRRLVSTVELTPLVAIFPKYYGPPLSNTRIVMVHFAGLGEYERKKRAMKAYSNIVCEWYALCGLYGENWPECKEFT